MASLDSDPTSDPFKPPSSSGSASSRSRLNRPASIGDASQLFGGGAGSDDFFGPPSTFAASLFDPVPEESANSSLVDHDPFAWPSTDQPHHPGPHEPSFNPNPTQAPDSSLTEHASSPYDLSSAHSSDHPNPYNPAANYHNSYHYAQDHHQPTFQSVYSSSNPNFAHPDQIHANGNPIPPLQATYTDQQPASDVYNPYVPRDTYATPQNDYSSHVSHPHLMPDVIPRSVSANALPSSASTNQSAAYLSSQRPKLAQSLTTQLTSSVFNRPKVYDAYDPPAIRKKRPTLNATASLPATPALGGHGFSTPTVPSNLAFVSPNTDFPPPPPPPLTAKQRSTSTPASQHEPAQVSLSDFNDFYNPASHNIHDAARQFVPSVYSHNDPNSSPMISDTFTSSSVNPYLPNPPTHYGPPIDQVTPKLGLPSQYPQNPPHPVDGPAYTQSSYSIVSSSTPAYSQTPQIEDPYAPGPAILPLDVDKSSTPLSVNDFFRPYEPSEPAGSNGTYKPKLKASSPLKSTVVNEGAPQQLNDEYHFSREQSLDPIDALSSATQNLSLNSGSMQDPLGSAAKPDQQITTNDVRLAPPAPPVGSSSKHGELMPVPDVHVQPATPQITLLEAHGPAPSSQFDVLADLNSSTDQAIISSEGLNQTPGNFDYGASNDLSFQYNSDYTYRTTQSNVQDSIVPLDNSRAYNPHYAPLDSHHTDPISNLNSYSGSNSVDFTNSDLPPLCDLSSDYNMTAETLAYGSTADPTSLHPENVSSDQVMAHHQQNTTTWTPGSTIDEPVLDTSTYNPYNPSPQPNADLTNRQVEDPMLERLTAQVPVASFGFGGKLITVFPASAGSTTNLLQAGYTDPYGPSGIYQDTGAGRTVVVQQLSGVIPSNDLQNFPGPLFMEGGSKSNLAKKRKEVVNWLEFKLDESEKELVFIQSQLVGRGLNGDSGKDSRVDNLHDKIILLKLLKLLVENEGKLSGNMKLDEAVRLALQPASSQLALDSHTIPSNDSNGQDIIATYHTRSSHLDSIQALLSNGDRQKAIQAAVEQRMWPHAFIIAHSLGNDTWHETVKEFVRFELGDGDMSSMNGMSSSDSPHPPSKGREGLRTLYTLFAGAGPAAVEEFSLSTTHPSPSVLQFEQQVMSAIPTGIANGTVASSRVPSPAPPLHSSGSSSIKIPNNVLQQWRSVVAMTIANRVHGIAPFLLRLGDTLASNGKTYAAHITYLLSNGQMPQLCLDNGKRITLLGTPTSSAPDRPGLELEAIMLTEVLEFGLSLCTVPKNVEPFIGIPHLQAYRLALGFEYATFGLVDRANKYCEALAATFKLATKPCAFYHDALFEQLKAFSGRLSSTPVADKGTSWITRKMPRPTLDNVWQTLEGRVHKFVAGDDDEGNNKSTSNLSASTTQKNQVLGPFSHYSCISAGSASEAVSRVQSSSDLGHMNPEPASALAGPFHLNAHLPRPSSGAGHSTSNGNQDPRRVSLSSSNNGSNFSPVDFLSFRGQTSSVPPLQHEQSSFGRASPANSTSQTTEAVGKENSTFTGSGGGWWEASNSYGTPINSTSQPIFESVQDTPIVDDGSGFINPMSSFAVPFTMSPAAVNTSSQQNEFDTAKSSLDHDDEEDLGFGNNSSRKRNESNGNNQNNVDEHTADSPTSNKVNDRTQQASERPTDAENKSVKPKPSTSWIGRWFQRETTPTSQGAGPVKANLGEEFSLVYDPETKRWVNKKAGSSQAPASSGPPPPPPRAQTASPTSSMRSSVAPPPASSMNTKSFNSNNNSPVHPPVNRSNSAGVHNATRSSSDVPSVSSGLSGNSSCNFSNLHQMNHSGTPPPPISNSLSSTLPPSSNSTTPNPSKKPNTKKNIRSRYVEIR